MPGNKPVHEIQAGNVQVAIWKKDEVENRKTQYSISIVKRYKDANGTWKNSTYYWMSEIPAILGAVQQALFWVWQQQDGKPSTTLDKGDSDFSGVNVDNIF